MNKIITMTISVIIAVAMICVVVIPVIESNQGSFSMDQRTTLRNEGTPMVQGNVADDYRIQWDSALPGTIKVNGNVTTVYFVAGDDATVSPSSKTVTEGLTYGELPTPTRTGYTFDGWYTSTQYTTEVTENTVVVGTQDKVLYAKWVANEYTVTFDADGGTVSPGTKTVTYGQAYGELPIPTYTGHIFGGWFNSDDEVITAQNIVDVADDQTLTAVWTLEQYTVSFTTDGNGTVDVQSLTVDYGTSYTISSNTVTIGSTTVTATPSGYYVFDHWTPGTSGTITESTTFMAYFNEPPVTLTFTAQSPGSVDVPSLADVPRGTQYVVADNTVVVGSTTVTASLPDGYYMTGWNIAQGVGTVSDAMTFTAQYETIEIADVVSSAQTTWILTTDGKLFGCGSASNGQQGSGATSNVTSFTQRLSAETIKMVSCSTTTTWAVTTDGKLFGCGYNASGQQGDGTTTDVTSFTQRLDTETIASVICSTQTTWVVTTDGKLFGCGESGDGQQGKGNLTDVKTFTQRLDTETIESVSCSQTTTWAVTTDGKLFGCGNNSYSQQGDGTTTNVKTFTQRLDTETIESVSCSQTTTWAVTTDGKLFGCGRNNYYQQGDGTTTDVTSFTQRLTDQTIVSITNSDETTWAVTTDGKLFGCGQATSGQQGNGSTTTVTSFTQRLSTETIKMVSCSSYTTWAVTTDGKLYGCGAASNGQQGSGENTNVTSFTQRLSTETITTVRADGVNATWTVTTDGKLYGCGAASNGQQGSGATSNVTSFTQRGPPGSVNIAVQLSPQQLNLNPINLNPGILSPAIQPLSLNSVTANDIISTDYTFLAGGNDWMLCTVSIGQDQYALALYYAGLSAPLLWVDDVTMVFSNGTMTVENNGQSYTMTYTSIYFPGNGDYVLMGDSAYVDSESTILGYSIPTTDIGIMVKGTPESVQAVSIADDSVTIGDATLTLADTDYDGVSTLSGASASYDTDSTATCTSIIVPNKVVVITPSEDNTIDDMISIIPVFMILATLIAIVSMIMVKNRY